MVTATKAAPRNFLERNVEFARENFVAYAARYSAGEIDRAQFARLMGEEMRSAAAAQFRFELGRAPTAPELDALNTVLTRHGAYLAGFVSAAGDLSPEALAARAALYGGAAVEAGAVGKIAATPTEGRITWQGPDGGSSCPDCVALIGRSWGKDEFLALGIRPGAAQCGPNCRCRLETVA